MPDEVELVRLLGTRFVQRRDVKAFQSEDGAWYPVRESMTMQDFQDHLAGRKTMGHYLLDHEDNCKLFAFDLDLVKHGRDCPGQGCKGCPVLVPGTDGVTYNAIPRDIWPQDHPVTPTITSDLRMMAEGLAATIHRKMEIPVAIAASGNKGLHVYGFTGTIHASAARALALETLNQYSVVEAFRGENFFRHKTEFHTLDIEVFPKQASLNGKDLGNLMSLPLGNHRVTGRRKFFIKTKGRMDTLTEMDPIQALSGDLPWA